MNAGNQPISMATKPHSRPSADSENATGKPMSMSRPSPRTSAGRNFAPGSAGIAAASRSGCPGRARISQPMRLITSEPRPAASSAEAQRDGQHPSQRISRRLLDISPRHTVHHQERHVDSRATMPITGSRKNGRPNKVDQHLRLAVARRRASTRTCSFRRSTRRAGITRAAACTTPRHGVGLMSARPAPTALPALMKHDRNTARPAIGPESVGQPVDSPREGEQGIHGNLSSGNLWERCEL